MSNGFIRSVLSTQKQRQRFFWFRNVISMLCAYGVFQFFANTGVAQELVWAAALAALVISYFTLAPVVAFIICFIEQMLS